MILVVGATGFLGSEICRQLTEKGKSVTALVRTTSDPGKIDNLKKLGAKLVYGDLKDRASLDRACQGISTVISTASTTISQQPDDSIPGVDRDGQRSLIDAAAATGVSRYIFISFSSNMNMDSPLVAAKRSVEAHLAQSGMIYTVLRPSYFMEAWLSPMIGFDFPNAKAQIYGDGTNGISWISLPDVASFTVAALDNATAENAVIELGGPEALSPLAVVHLFEMKMGRRFEIQHIPMAALRAQNTAATDPLQQSFSALMINYAEGDVIDMEVTLNAFPLQLTSVEMYADRVLAG